MSRKPSAETEVRRLKTDMTRLHKEAAEIRVQLSAYRARATKAEQECAEWKARFDALLKRDQPFQATTAVSACVCAQHKPGETTGGWFCPAHGQRP